MTIVLFSFFIIQYHKTFPHEDKAYPILLEGGGFRWVEGGGPGELFIAVFFAQSLFGQTQPHALYGRVLLAFRGLGWQQTKCASQWTTQKITKQRKQIRFIQYPLRLPRCALDNRMHASYFFVTGSKLWPAVNENLTIWRGLRFRSKFQDDLTANTWKWYYFCIFFVCEPHKNHVISCHCLHRQTEMNNGTENLCTHEMWRSDVGQMLSVVAPSVDIHASMQTKHTAVGRKETEQNGISLKYAIIHLVWNHVATLHAIVQYVHQSGNVWLVFGHSFGITRSAISDVDRLKIVSSFWKEWCPQYACQTSNKFEKKASVQGLNTERCAVLRALICM